MCFVRFEASFFPFLFLPAEPDLLADLSRRVEEAEREFQAQDLDQKLTDLEAAKQRQVRSVAFFGSKLNEAMSLIFTLFTSHSLAG